MNRSDILDEAKRLTMTDREQTYGDCVETHEKIAAMWSVILDKPVKAHEVALCMAAMKVVRSLTSTDRMDNFIDGAAYFAIAGQCVVEEHS